MIDVVIITADVEHGEMTEKQLRGIVMRLKPMLSRRLFSGSCRSSFQLLPARFNKR